MKDPEKKEHPCMVPYDKLPVTQRSEDCIFIGVVRALLDHVNTTSTMKLMSGPDYIKEKEGE